MKKLKKMLAVGLVSMLAVSAMSFSAFAKTEIPLENGAVLIMYEDGDIIPDVPQTRATAFSFSSNFPKYPSYQFAHDKVFGDSDITVAANEDTIRIVFSQKPNVFYMNIYSDYDGKFLTNGTNGLQIIRGASKTFDIDGLHPGKYNIGFAGNTVAADIAGTISTF